MSEVPPTPNDQEHAERELRKKRIQGELVRNIVGSDLKTYLLYKNENPGYDPDFWVYFTLYDEENLNPVGRVEIFEEDFAEANAPNKFLNIPPKLHHLPFFRTKVEVREKAQGKGLGKQLAESMRSWFEGQPAHIVHLVYFTQLGEKRLSQGFLTAGYAQLEVTDKKIERLHVGADDPDELLWIYKVYGRESV